MARKEDELTHLDLFSGIGGFSLAAESCGFKTILFCEIDEFCQKVLKKHWSETPLIPDIRDVDGTEWRGATLLTGGFPCQPFSVAGPRRGKEDNRHLWPEMLRIIKEARPAWVLGENVDGIVRMELDNVLTDLENTGYSTQAIVIPACAKNAPHRRNRVWIVANSKSERDRRGSSKERRIYRGKLEPEKQEGNPMGSEGEGCLGLPNASDSKRFGSIENTDGINAQGAGEKRDSQKSLGLPAGENKAWEKNWLEVAASFCRVDDGLPSWIYSDRVKRLKALGNAIVPQIAKEIIKGISDLIQQ